MRNLLFIFFLSLALQSRGQAVYRISYPMYSEQLEQLANSGDLCAKTLLAEYYIGGKGVEKNCSKAFNILSSAVSENHHDLGLAYYLLGHCYEEGCGVKQNFKEAFDMYQKSSDLEESTGILSLARCYEEGIGVKNDYKKAAELYEKVLSGFWGNRRYTKVRVGNIYLFELGETEKGLKYLKEAADAGSGAALYYLGQAYDSGTGVEKNPQNAVEYYQQSIDAETYPFVLTILADHYYEGNGVKKDIERAIELYKDAARMGDETAKEKLKEIEQLH